MERDFAARDGLGRRTLQLIDGNEPLFGKPRFKGARAAIAMHHRMMVVFHMIEQAVLLKPRDNGFAAFLAAHAGKFAVAFNHVGGFVEDIDFLEAMRSPIAKSFGREPE